MVNLLRTVEVAVGEFFLGASVIGIVVHQLGLIKVGAVLTGAQAGVVTSHTVIIDDHSELLLSPTRNGK